MASQIKSHVRSRQILSLLVEHGPLSFRSLSHLVEPKMKDRRLHDSLARLVKRDLIVRRHEKLFRGTGIFYQIGQTDSTRAEACRILGLSVDNVLQPQFRRRELLHAEACALWAHYLRRQFPGFKVLRDYEILQDNYAKRALLSSGSDPELMPDLLLIYRRENSSLLTTVAFEIERSQKSSQRLVAKLKKYCSGSLIDGVIYVCSSDRIEQAVQAIYKNKVVHRAHRIKHYAANFLMFCRDDERPNIAASHMRNSEMKNVPFSTWFTHLSSTHRPQRIDSEFKTSAVTC